MPDKARLPEPRGWVMVTGRDGDPAGEFSIRLRVVLWTSS